MADKIPKKVAEYEGTAWGRPRWHSFGAPSPLGRSHGWLCRTAWASAAGARSAPVGNRSWLGGVVGGRAGTDRLRPRKARTFSSTTVR